MKPLLAITSVVITIQAPRKLLSSIREHHIQNVHFMQDKQIAGIEHALSNLFQHETMKNKKVDRLISNFTVGLVKEKVLHFTEKHD